MYTQSRIYCVVPFGASIYSVSSYRFFGISTGPGKKHPLRNEEFIEPRICERERKNFFPGHETATSQPVYSNEENARIIAMRFIAKVGAEISRERAI